MKILEIKRITKKYGNVFALRNLSMAIEQGKITGIIGPNGSGKTTLVNILSGMTSFDSGNVIINNKVVVKLLSHEAISHKITRTFQETRLFGQMTVFDNLIVVCTKKNVFASIFQQYSEEDKERVNKILKKIGLANKKNDLASSLSYGQRKLLEISRALLTNADIFLFDEPFAGLFPEMVEIVTKILQELIKENKTIILIEHDMKIIRKITDYIFVLDSGSLLAEGKPSATLAKYNVIEAYLGD
jgi:ABC-type branched-subunit amino acid transport system ATPase component